MTVRCQRKSCMTWNTIKMSDALNHLLIPAISITTIRSVHVNGVDALKKQIVPVRLYDGESAPIYWVTFFHLHYEFILSKTFNFAGAYAPDCDTQGFYKSTQCHNSVGVCWCVDKHGVEFANTRTRGKPSCGNYSIP